MNRWIPLSLLTLTLLACGADEALPTPGPGNLPSEPGTGPEVIDATFSLYVAKTQLCYEIRAFSHTVRGHQRYYMATVSRPPPGYRFYRSYYPCESLARPLVKLEGSYTDASYGTWTTLLNDPPDKSSVCRYIANRGPQEQTLNVNAACDEGDLFAVKIEQGFDASAWVYSESLGTPAPPVMAPLRAALGRLFRQATPIDDANAGILGTRKAPYPDDD